MYTLQPLVLREEVIFQKHVSPTQNNRVIWAKDTKINAKKLGGKIRQKLPSSMKLLFQIPVKEFSMTCERKNSRVTHQEDKINLLYHNFSSLDVLTTLLTHWKPTMLVKLN